MGWGGGGGGEALAVFSHYMLSEVSIILCHVNLEKVCYHGWK